MEEGIGKGDLEGNGVRLSSLRPSGNFKPTLSGRSSPGNSPSFRRLHSGRTPQREAREVEVLKLAAGGVEFNTIHPVGKAIVEAAKVANCQNVKAFIFKPFESFKLVLGGRMFCCYWKYKSEMLRCLGQCQFEIAGESIRSW